MVKKGKKRVKKQVKKLDKRRYYYSMVPLPRTFMVSSMLGLLITTVYTSSGRIDLTWGTSFGLVFLLMFIASVLSITPRFPDELSKK